MLFKTLAVASALLSVGVSAQSSIQPSSTQASAPASIATPTSTVADAQKCSAFVKATDAQLQACIQRSLPEISAIANQAAADTAFAHLAECVCPDYLLVKDQYIDNYNQCKDPGTLRPYTEAEKSALVQGFDGCAARTPEGYLSAAFGFEMFLDIRGRKYHPSPPGAAASAGPSSTAPTARPAGPAASSAGSPAAAASPAASAPKSAATVSVASVFAAGLAGLLATVAFF
ncbi:hypothetical protein HDU86_004142 [Geranomyces michiganensis]|nr:hypothetical protein HDU86_004142 [Geranomyces michiganensis]